MGLHDLETMNEVSAKTKEINPSIVIYGEPWSGGSSTLSDALSAKQMNGNKYDGYGQFNDQMRDALIRGGLSADNELGWVTDREDKISTDYINKLLKGVKGETYSGVADIADPDKSVSYVTCHDNYTLYDRVMATKSGANEETAKKMNRLANSVVFTSQGTSFMLAGEEMLRTKGGNKNSYNASYKTNELDYSLKIKHADLFEDYQKMIALKKELDGLHMDKEEIKSLSPKLSDDGGMLNYSFAAVIEDKNAQVRVVHKNGLSEEEKVDFAGYTVLWSTEEGIKKSLNTETVVKPFETIIAYKAV